jgi:hypothetical protein
MVEAGMRLTHAGRAEDKGEESHAVPYMLPTSRPERGDKGEEKMPSPSRAPTMGRRAAHAPRRGRGRVGDQILRPPA